MLAVIPCAMPRTSAQAKMVAPLPDHYKGTLESSNSPAVVLRADEKLLETPIDEAEEVAGETYSPSDRKYAGMPSIARTGNRLWATWRSGYTWEGKYNYFPIVYSEDDGETWVDPYFIVDHPDAKGSGIGVGTPELWTDPDGNLWLFYTTGGVWAIKFTGADGDVSKITWATSHIIYEHLIAKKPTVIKNAEGQEEWMVICYSTSNAGLGLTSTAAFVSTDKGESWTERGRAFTDATNLRKYAEANVYQTSDGTLYQVCRLDGGGGGLERSASYDYGKTWSSFERYLGEPFSGPASKPHYLSLGDGKLLAINHASETSRTALTAYLSEDDGKTWQYKLLLDDREDVSYPDVAYERGKIYIVYDRDRAGAQEIRLARITVEDIKAGKLVSDSSALRLRLWQNSELKDIVSVQEELPEVLSVALGAKREAALKSLPTTLHVTDEDGTVYTLTGSWYLPVSFSTEKAASYTAQFRTSALPESLQDAYGKLVVTVLTKKEDKGCSGALTGLSAIAGILLLGAALLWKKRSKI